MTEDDPDPFDIAEGARRLALDIVIRALINHAADGSKPAGEVAGAEAYLDDEPGVPRSG